MTLVQQLDKMIQLERRVINPGCVDEVQCKALLVKLRALYQAAGTERTDRP